LFIVFYNIKLDIYFKLAYQTETNKGNIHFYSKEGRKTVTARQLKEPGRWQGRAKLKCQEGYLFLQQTLHCPTGLD
jgi:hypothetical protein